MTSDNILNILNDALEKDPVAMMALISTTVPTNSNIASSYDIKIHKGYMEFGLLSIINKIIEKENKKISFDYDVNIEGEMRPKKFVLTVMDPERFEFWRWAGEIFYHFNWSCSVLYYRMDTLQVLTIIKYGIPLLAVLLLLCAAKLKMSPESFIRYNWNYWGNINII